MLAMWYAIQPFIEITLYPNLVYLVDPQNWPPNSGLDNLVFVRLWLSFSPIYAGVVWYACWHYVGSVSLWKFNWTRPIWTTIWTSLFWFLAVITIWGIRYEMDSVLYLPLVLNDLWLIWLLLCLRSAIVFKEKRVKTLAV
jgi:hypothetical protein